MIFDIPQYCLRAYALFYIRHDSRETFRQNELDWIVSPSMKKKIFSVLLNSGWIKKESRYLYKCENIHDIMKGLLEFKVPTIIKKSNKKYAFTNLSAIEIWSDYSYVQRSLEKSPYFLKVLKKDLVYWKIFFNKQNIPNYINQGSAIGEYVILMPVNNFKCIKKDDLFVEPIKTALRMAKNNENYLYPYNYMRRKYGIASS